VTPTQFAALAELLRLRAGPAEAVARAVMIGGMSVSDAAKGHGVSYQAAYKAVGRVERGLELARTATADCSPV